MCPEPTAADEAEDAAHHRRRFADAEVVDPYSHGTDPRRRPAEVMRFWFVIGVTVLALLAIYRGLGLDRHPAFAVYGFGVVISTLLFFGFSFLRYKDPSTNWDDPRIAALEGRTVEEPVIDLRDAPHVTALVAVFNDEAVIGPCVQSMLDSTYTNLHVVVVNDCSTDGTAEALAPFENHPRVTVIHLEENLGKKAALTRGALVARGEYLVFTDSDCVVAPGAIERIMIAFDQHPEYGAFSGHARALNAEHSLLARIQDVWYDGQFGVAKAAEATFGSVTCVSGPLAAFRREAVINFLPAWEADEFLGQPFRFATDRQLTGYVLGAPWVGERARAAHADHPLVTNEHHPDRHWRVGYVRSARVYTNVPSTFRGLIKQQVRWKKSFLRNLFFTGRFLFRRGLGPAALFYGHAVWVAAAPVLAFRHLVLLPVAGMYLTTALYLAGIIVKGLLWGIAYWIQNRGDRRWLLRPIMSLLSATVLCWLLIYSAATIRKAIWSREESEAPDPITPAPPEGGPAPTAVPAAGAGATNAAASAGAR